MRVARNALPADPGRIIGLTAAAIQLALALVLGALASQAMGFPNPPDPLPRPIALTLLYALPVAVGAIGALRGRSSLLAAAAAATAVGAFLAFSGVTLIFLLPALLFGVAAGRTAPVAPGKRSALDHLTGLAIGLVLVGLMVGAGVALFATTETRCWTFHETGAGIEYRETPVTDTFTGGVGDQVGGGCNGGMLTARGAAVASVLGFGAVAVAAVVSARRR